MGHLTVLHLVNVKMKDESVPIVRKALKTKKGRDLAPLVYFLEQAFLTDGGYLEFKPTENYYSPYVADEEYGTVPAVIGKWYEAEKVAEWLKIHSEAGGRLIQHSHEGDGGAWGWEFNGRGKLRELALCSIGKWK